MDKPSGGLNQRIFAWALSRFSARYEQFAAKYKERLFAGLSGTALEIGPGTGVNLRYFRRDVVRWIGVKPNFFMERYLREEAARLGMAVDLRAGTADHLPADDGSVDAVISTLVLCCVPDQRKSLREIMRALKTGGHFVFIEHVAAAPGSRLRRIQNLLTPVWRRLGDGCHPNRETGTELERAGFAQISYEKVTAPVPVVSPQIVGVATKG
ncbi:MAG TPA: class I SAM-dependent methyltransferase [Bryobacteraceae bacterium]|jgi:ubiquinone/menaquinone biosynthesis C-methylase UbiE|nr:class I SAM-dependent methyltransferase [Bryobacteraceae bacterium]